VSSASEETSPKLSRNIEKVARSLFADVETQHAFLCAIEQGESGVTGVVWLYGDPQPGSFQTGARPEWLPSWIDVAAEGERPGKLAAHEQGDVYCMDLSSTFACAALSAIPDHVEQQLKMEASGKYASTPGYNAQRFTPLQWEHHRRLRASVTLNQVPH
jgi:hypothetical protein